MVDLIRLPNGTVITPQELSDQERLAYLEALIHLSAPVLARLLAGIGPTSGGCKSESKDSMAATREKYADLPPVLTIDEAAKVLAVSKSTVYEMTRRWQGKFFTHFRIGNRIRVPRDKLVEWINAGVSRLIGRRFRRPTQPTKGARSFLSGCIEFWRSYCSCSWL